MTNLGGPSPAKLRNLVAVLRAHFAQPDNYSDEGWAVHLEETAKLMWTVSRVSGQTPPPPPTTTTEV